MHQDIKSSNILVNPENLKIWLIDFGSDFLPSSLLPPPSSLTHSASLSDIFQCESEMSDLYLGTPLYMSPHILSRTLHNPLAADIWSSGVLFWELMLGHQPFDGLKREDEILRQIKLGFRFVGMSRRCETVLHCFLKKNEVGPPFLLSYRHVLRPTGL